MATESESEASLDSASAEDQDTTTADLSDESVASQPGPGGGANYFQPTLMFGAPTYLHRGFIMVRPGVSNADVVGAVQESRAHNRPLDLSAVTIPVGLHGYYSAAVLRNQRANGASQPAIPFGIAPCADCGLRTRLRCPSIMAETVEWTRESIEQIPNHACTTHLSMPYCSDCSRYNTTCHYCRGVPWCTAAAWSYSGLPGVRHTWPPPLSPWWDDEASDAIQAWYDSDSDVQ